MTVVEREKREGEKAKGAEFEPRRSQNFLLKPLLPEAFPSRQGGDILLFVQIQLMCGAARIILLSVNASSDDPNQLNVF